MNARAPKLVFVNRVYWPDEAATAQLLSDLATALAARGWPVHVVAAGNGPASHQGVTVHRTGGETTHAGGASRAMNYAGFLHAARKTLSALVTQGDVVVLMTDPPLLAAACTTIARRRRAHVLQWIQDIYPEVAVQHAGRWAAPLLAPLTMARNHAWNAADRCIVVGSDMRAAVTRAGVPAARSLSLHNWAPREIDAASEPTKLDETRAAWSLSNEFVVAYSGNMGRVHEFDTLLDAAEHLRYNPAIVFVFIGGGARLPEVRAAADHRRLRNVRFLPAQPRERLAATLAAADAHVVTLRPGFQRWVNPSKLQGALGAGRPVLFVGPTDSAIAALLAREKCGRSFPVGAGRELANEIESLAADPAARLALSHAARATYERHFSFDAAVACWEELLRRTCRMTS